jgi:hypothetical protein
VGNSAVADEMKELAQAIEQIARASKCWSAVHGIIYNCTDHLRADAYVRETQAREFKVGGDAGRQTNASSLGAGKTVENPAPNSSPLVRAAVSISPDTVGSDSVAADSHPPTLSKPTL